MKRVATIGDVHGCIDELQDLYKRLEWESIDEIRHAGDLVDRGPDSGAVVAFCREKNIQGVMGNHEQSILSHLNRVAKGGHQPRNPEKLRTISQLTDPRDVEYLRKLPLLAIDDAVQTVYVHGGLWPNTEWFRQPDNVCRAQLIHLDLPGRVKWFNKHHDGTTEEDNKKDGWVRWYEVYDHQYNVVYGHTVWQFGPMVHRNSGMGATIGVDTGCNWTGELTAVILPDLRFIQTLKKREFTIFHQIRPED